jgi:tubulin-specific chaperone E
VVCANSYSHQQGKSDLATAASFVRPARPTNTPLSFLEALHKKYASGPLGTTSSGGPLEGQKATEAPIKWGSKVVEEVGFEKIRRQLAILNELRIVILDGMSIACASREKGGQEATEQIRQTCPKIIELDLGRNLFEKWMDIVYICEALKGLRSLRVKYAGTRREGTCLD